VPRSGRAECRTSPSFTAPRGWRPARTAPIRVAWDRLHASAFLLVVAIDQVLAFEHRVRKLTGDGELAKARASFDAAYPMVNRLRDYIAHPGQG
jgi:hypothetical protein